MITGGQLANEGIVFDPATTCEAVELFPSVECGVPIFYSFDDEVLLAPALAPP